MAKVYSRGKRPAPYELIDELRGQVAEYPAEEAVFALSWAIVNKVNELSLKAPQKAETIGNVIDQLRAMFIFKS